MPLATDGNPDTAWQTESYQYPNGSLGPKSGVGLVVAASRPVSPKEITVKTQSPGFDAEIKAGDSPTGPFTAVSGGQQTSSETTFPIHDGTTDRYYVIWITARGSTGRRAYVNEVTATP